MTFTLRIRVDTQKTEIKHRVMEQVAAYLQKKGYRFDVGFDPTEIDFDSIGEA